MLVVCMTLYKNTDMVKVRQQKHRISQKRERNDCTRTHRQTHTQRHDI